VREAAMAPPARRPARGSQRVGPSQPAVEQVQQVQQAPVQEVPVQEAPVEETSQVPSGRQEADPGQARLSPSEGRSRGSQPLPKRSVQLKINIQPAVPSSIPTHVYLNDEKVALNDGVLTVPLDQLVSIRVERPLFYTYKNSFVLNSRDLRPGGRFDLDIQLKVFR
jgi:hypothetical protein